MRDEIMKIYSVRYEKSASYDRGKGMKYKLLKIVNHFQFDDQEYYVDSWFYVHVRSRALLR